MTILEELIEFALVACERGRASVAGVSAQAAANHNACRGASVLGPDGKVRSSNYFLFRRNYIVAAKGLHWIRYSCISDGSPEPGSRRKGCISIGRLSGVSEIRSKLYKRQ